MKNFRSLAAVIIPLLWVWVGAVWGQQADAGSGGDLRAAAEGGDRSAQCRLGFKYFTGDGVKKDFKEAAQWYRKAAEQGDAVAQNNLGLMFLEGKGVARNDAEAARWLFKAAEQGVDRAQNQLGSLYEEGRGVARNAEQAAKWYRKSADHGYAPALNNLGYLYFRGELVNEDWAEAYKWFSLAAMQGDKEGARNRDRVQQLMNSERINDAKNRLQAYLAQQKKPEETYEAAPPR